MKKIIALLILLISLLREPRYQRLKGIHIM